MTRLRLALCFGLYGVQYDGILRANLMTAIASDALRIAHICDLSLDFDRPFRADFFALSTTDTFIRYNGTLLGRPFTGDQMISRVWQDEPLVTGIIRVKKGIVNFVRPPFSNFCPL